LNKPRSITELANQAFDKSESAPVAVLTAFDSHHQIKIKKRSQCYELHLMKDDINVKVTVPKEVPEWFVDVITGDGKVLANDWCDYAGYTDLSDKRIADDMAEDLNKFVTSLLERPLRLTNSRGKFREKFSLEWQIDNSWSNAVPFSSGGLDQNI